MGPHNEHQKKNNKKTWIKDSTWKIITSHKPFPHMFLCFEPYQHKADVSGYVILFHPEIFGKLGISSWISVSEQEVKKYILKSRSI